MIRTVFCVIILLYLNIPRTHAQLLDGVTLGLDSTCISDQSDKLLLRTFVMQKFNKYTLGHEGVPQNVTYRANDNYNIGIGGHYKWLGLNVSFRMPFVNSDEQRYGKTKFFDLQSYLYLRKFAVDLFVLSYRGYYLTNSNILQAPPPNNDLLIRNDLRTGNYGVNFQYIFNNSKFSYRAAFLQNQCQMRSAGSVIAGGAMHYTRVRADSAVIPMNTLDQRFFMQSQFNKSATYAIAVNGGYAYTQVIGKHFFITGALLVGAGLNYTDLKTDATDSKDSRLSSQLHGIVRAAGGYNTDKYFLGVQYINFVNRNNTTVNDAWQQLQAGNIRITYAQRFVLKKRTVKRIEKIEGKMKDQLGEKVMVPVEKISDKMKEQLTEKVIAPVEKIGEKAIAPLKKTEESDSKKEK